MVVKNCIFTLSATFDSRAKFEPSSLSSPCQVYHDKQEGGEGEGGMNRSIGSGSIGQYAFSAPLTNSKGNGAEHKAVTRMYVSVLFL